MVPATFTSPNPLENATLNQATALTAIFASLGLIVESTLVQIGEGNSYAGLANTGYATTAQAIAEGATDTDPMLLVFTLQGLPLGSHFSVADCWNCLKNNPGLSGVQTLFNSIYPYGGAQQAINAILALPTVVAAIKAELKAVTA